MLAYLARRTSYMVLILLLSSVAIFYSLRFAPGDPTGTVLNPLTVAEVRAQIREELGLNEPVYKQYFTYMGNLLQGDLGHSLVTGASIGELLREHGKNSLILGFTALGLSYFIAVPLGVLAAVRRNSWLDQLSMGGAVLGMGVPNFWLALLLVWLFSLQLGWLPSAGCCGGKELILPAVVLAAEGTAVTLRMVRASMLEQLNQDYVRTLRAKGLPEWNIVGRHVLRNALIPVISLTGLRLGWIVGYTLIVETIFSWPGVGFLLVDSVLRRDYPVAQFFSLLLVFFVITANWLSDIGYGLANPRIRRATA
jgi:ABC-type dipeptide/oligopeptide/nickel transport system permease component